LEFADLIFFFKGFIAGLMIATPVGPIGMLCIERTLVKGSLNGFVSGVGAATADLLYSSVAAFGLTVISDFLVGQQMWLRLFGGIFLIFLGLQIYRHRNKQPAQVRKGRGYLSDFCSAFVVTFFNPVTVLAFIAIFAGFGMVGTTKASAFMLVGGVFVGSSSWWIGLCGFAAIFGNKLKSTNFLWLTKVSAVIIIVFGIVMLLSFRR